MSRLSKSFSARLSATILLITSVLFLTAITIVSYFSHKMIGEEASKNAANILNSATKEINMSLGKIETTVSNLQWVVYEHREDTAYMYHITTELVKENEDIVGSTIAFIPDYFPGKHYFAPYTYSVVGSDRTISKQLGNAEYDYFKMEWFTVSLETKQKHWSQPYYEAGGGQMLMSTFSIPLMNPDGNVYAIMTADIELNWLNSKISALRPYVNSQAFLLSRNGQFIAGSHSGLNQEQNIFKIDKSSEFSRFKLLGELMVAGDSGTLQIRNDKEISFAVYGPLENGWSTAIISPYKDVFALSSRMNIIILMVLVLGLLLLFIICFRIIRKLTKPISEFSKAAMNIAKGNLQTRLPEITSHDEMLQLHDSFEHMQNSLSHYISELQSTTAEKERYESELYIARAIQMEMVPTDFPQRKDLSVHALLRPAKEVGGDFYDFLIKDNLLFFAIGDVSGKGVPAALVMAITRAAFRFLGGLDLTLNQIVSKINSTLSQRNENSMFVTLFAGCIDLKNGTMHYCNAGHNPIVICHANGHAEYLRAKTNIAIGIVDSFVYESEQTTLEPGSRIILYTDGVTEAENAKKNQFGMDNLLTIARQIPKEENSKDVVNRIIREVETFTDKADQNDDITILTISLSE